MYVCSEIIIQDKTYKLYFKYRDSLKNNNQCTMMPTSQLQYQKQEDEQEELQISSFIKDPVTLKLLILAGTNIKSSQLPTVAKCSNLIKLDLSSNMLTQIPINFTNFLQLKILYLHDNSIFHIDVKNQTVEYMTLFNNPFKNYRQKVVDSNPNLMALDYHIITNRERYRKLSPPLFTQLKWPVVEASAALQNEEDYLNLLKAEIFVITNLHKRSNCISHIECAITGFTQFCQYQRSIRNLSDEMRMKKACVIDAVNQWKSFVHKKAKLQRFLESINKQHLLFNNLDLRKTKRSPQTNSIIERFIQSVRSRLRARKILQPQLRSYRQYMPTAKHLVSIYKTATSTSAQHYRLYFLKSQLHFLSKIFLYAKRLLFARKQYDLCDNFERIVALEKKQYYVFRMRGKNVQERSFLRQTIRRTCGVIVVQKNVDRKHVLYTKRGHRMVGLKNRGRVKFSEDQLVEALNKASHISNNLQRMYDNYDTLISYQIIESRLFQLLMRIIRYFNSGNSDVILSNQTAYFQTQVSFEGDQKQKQKQKIFVGLEFFIKRVLAANVIQRFWRRKMGERRCGVDLIKTIRTKRASAIISHWLRELPFRQRLLMNKMYSYKKTVHKSTDIYIQLDIYMNLPNPTNRLKIPKYEPIANNSNEILYQALHKNTCVQIIELCRRKWIRVVFQSVQKALHAYKLFLFTTFKFYYNGFYLQLFSYFQAQEHSQLQIYEKRVKNLYNIEVKKSLSQASSMSVSKKLAIQNTDAYFIWPEVDQRGLQQRYEMQKKSFPISIFVYNRHQKPLKINCDFNWLNPSSIYYYKPRVLKSTSYHTSIRSRTPTKRLQSLGSSKTRQETSFIRGEDIQRHYLTKIRSSEKRDRRSSEISPHNTVLLRNHRFKNRTGMSQNIQVDLSSHTLSIKRK